MSKNKVLAYSQIKEPSGSFFRFKNNFKKVFTPALVMLLLHHRNNRRNKMTQERLHYLLVGKFETKVDVQDKLTARPAKIGIAKLGDSLVKADPSYSKKSFKW